MNSLPEACVPSLVTENFRGCPALEALDTSNFYLNPTAKSKEGDLVPDESEPPAIRKTFCEPEPSSATVTVNGIVRVLVPAVIASKAV